MKIELTRDTILTHAKDIEQILRRAVRHALLQHKRAGNPIAAWKDGQVVWIPADQIEVDDPLDE